MRKCVPIFAISLLLFGCVATPKPNFHPEQPNLKIVSYNVNYGFVNSEDVVEYLVCEDADVVCLQETHRYWENVLTSRLSEKYPHRIFRESEAASGIAIMSRYRLQDIKLIEPAEGWFPALFARIQTPVGLIQVLNVHLRPPLADNGAVSIGAYYRAKDIHSEEIGGFIKHTKSNEPLIVLGDFNENEKSKAIRQLVEDGFTDALSIYDRNSETWVWKTSAGIELKNRYDHILYNNYLVCTGAKVTSVNASDHMPVAAVITRKD